MSVCLLVSCLLSFAALPDPPRLTPEQLSEVQSKLLHDFGGLIRYGSENTEVPPPRAGENRVVFLGDDITEGWNQQLFAGRSWLNRGITGQTSAQMLLRFRQDVISLKPKVVVIQAGSNDLTGLFGPATQPMIAENIMSMVELAKLHGIRVVLASLTPVCDCSQKETAIRPVGKILGINEWLKGYAQQSGAVYLNLYTPLVQGRALRPEFTKDGFQLSDAGYAVLAPIVEQAITQALKQ